VNRKLALYRRYSTYIRYRYPLKFYVSVYFYCSVVQYSMTKRNVIFLRNGIFCCIQNTVPCVKSLIQLHTPSTKKKTYTIKRNSKTDVCVNGPLASLTSKLRLTAKLSLTIVKICFLAIHHNDRYNYVTLPTKLLSISLREDEFRYRFEFATLSKPLEQHSLGRL
jgi:hypothetical protein